MALSEHTQATLARRLGAYCEARVPTHARDKVRLGFRIRGHEVELFEARLAFRKPHDWQELPISKFRYVGTQRIWRLYCQHRDLRWHEYQARPTARSFEVLLNEVDADPTGIFWG